MRSSIRKAFGVGYAVLAAGALTFGARQALASPAAAEAQYACTKDQAIWCNNECAERVGPGYRGRCTIVYGRVSCECIPIYTP